MSTIRQRLDRVRAMLSPLPYRWLPLLFGALYLLVMVGTYLYIYNGDLRIFYGAFPRWYTWTFSAFTLAISALFGTTLTLAIAKVRELKLKAAGPGVAGIAFAALAAGCPGCFFGLFPLALGLFGVTGTLAVLPWNGIELQVATVALLSLSIVMLGEETRLACEIPRRKGRGPAKAH